MLWLLFTHMNALQGSSGECKCGGNIVKGLSVKPKEGNAILFWSMVSIHICLLYKSNQTDFSKQILVITIYMLINNVIYLLYFTIYYKNELVLV